MIQCQMLAPSYEYTDGVKHTLMKLYNRISWAEILFMMHDGPAEGYLYTDLNTNPLRPLAADDAQLFS